MLDEEGTPEEEAADGQRPTRQECNGSERFHGEAPEWADGEIESEPLIL
jgi:hypothetical protein